MSDGNNIEVGFQVTGADAAAAEIQKVGDAAKAAAEPSGGGEIHSPMGVFGSSDMMSNIAARRSAEAANAAATAAKEAATAAEKATRSEEGHAGAMIAAAAAAAKEADALSEVEKAEKKQSVSAEEAEAAFKKRIADHIEHSKRVMDSHRAEAASEDASLRVRGARIASFAAMAGGMISQFSDRIREATKDSNSDLANMAGGAAKAAGVIGQTLSGASQGFMLGGPWGAAAGAALGIVQGTISLIDQEEKEFERRQQERIKRQAAFGDALIRETVEKNRKILDNERQLQEERAKDAESGRRIEEQDRKNAAARRRASFLGTDDDGGSKEKVARVMDEYQSDVASVNNAIKTQVDEVNKLDQAAKDLSKAIGNLAEENARLSRRQTSPEQVQANSATLRNWDAELEALKAQKNAALDDLNRMESEARGKLEDARVKAVSALREMGGNLQKAATEAGTAFVTKLREGMNEVKAARGGGDIERGLHGNSIGHYESKIAGNQLDNLVRSGGVVAPNEMDQAAKAAALALRDRDAQAASVAVPAKRIIEENQKLREGMSEINEAIGALGDVPVGIMKTVKDQTAKAENARAQTDLELRKKQVEEQKQRAEKAEKDRKLEEDREKKRNQEEDRKRQQAEERAMRASEARVRKTEESLMRNAQAGSALGEAAVSKLNQHTSDLALLKGRIR